MASSNTQLFDDAISGHIISVAVPVPLRQSFDFLVPEFCQSIVPGARVRVPFGARKLIGIILEVKSESDYPENKLRRALEVLDETSLFDQALWDTLQWLSRYYLAPIGEVIDAALSTVSRQGGDLRPALKTSWALTDHGLSVIHI